VTVTVVPEIATDWPARRSTSSEVEVLFTVNPGAGKLKVKDVVASVGVATTGAAVALM